MSLLRLKPAEVCRVSVNKSRRGAQNVTFSLDITSFFAALTS